MRYLSKKFWFSSFPPIIYKKLFNNFLNFKQYTHYEEAAKALGTQSLFLDCDMDVKQVREALAQVMARSRAEKQSLVVNVLIGKTNFREGSISV